MLTLYDYLPSQNAYKIRLLLAQLGMPYRTELISIFEGGGQVPGYLSVNPTGAVPAIRLDDGRVLSESNAILGFLAEGSRFLPRDAFLRAKVAQWLSFEADYVQSTIGTLRYWTMTGKLPNRPASLLEMKRGGSLRALGILDTHLATSAFLVGDQYTIADLSVFAYAHRAHEAGIALGHYPRFNAWTDRVRSQPGFVDAVFPYSIDIHATHELP